jgi:IS605 OrfB family transposase
VVLKSSADLGMNNLMTLSFSQGDKGMVVSNQRLERKIGLFDQKLDALKTALATPKLRELQKLHDAKKLNKFELIELRSLQKAVFDHPEMQHLSFERRNWLKNALHTLSGNVVDALVVKGIEVLIVGKNKGWKSESNMGRQQNRRFHLSAHAEFIEMLRYKCEDNNILLITTEESYTSKTSFATHESLKVFKKKDETDHIEIQPVQLSTDVSLIPDSQVQSRLMTEPKRCKRGRRRAVKNAKSKALHQFVSKSDLPFINLGKWTQIHADMNGAYNI